MFCRNFVRLGDGATFSSAVIAGIEHITSLSCYIFSSLNDLLGVIGICVNLAADEAVESYGNRDLYLSK